MTASGRAHCNRECPLRLKLQRLHARILADARSAVSNVCPKLLARGTLRTLRQGGSLRIINFMTFVVAILLLAMIPAYLQFVRLSGLHFSTSLATISVLCVVAAAAVRRA